MCLFLIALLTLRCKLVIECSVRDRNVGICQTNELTTSRQPCILLSDEMRVFDNAHYRSEVDGTIIFSFRIGNAMTSKALTLYQAFAQNMSQPLPPKHAYAPSTADAYSSHHQ